MARINWRAGRRAQAVREFTQALEESRDDQERFYLTLCIDGLKAAQSAAER
jgi:hypothetical protein